MGSNKTPNFLVQVFLSALAYILIFFLLPGRVNSKAAPYRTYDILRFTIICWISFYLLSNLKSPECKKSIFWFKFSIMPSLRLCRSWRPHISLVPIPITTMPICKPTECCNIIKHRFANYIYPFTVNVAVYRHWWSCLLLLLRSNLCSPAFHAWGRIIRKKEIVARGKRYTCLQQHVEEAVKTAPESFPPTVAVRW